MLPFIVPVLEGVAGYIGYDVIGKKLFGNTKTNNLPIPIKSKKVKSKQKTTFPLAPKKSNLPVKKDNDIIDVEIISDKPKKTLIDVLDSSHRVNSIMSSSTIANLAKGVLFLETISTSLSSISEAMEFFKDELQFRKNPVELKDLEGNIITKLSPREIEAIQRATRAKLDSDENSLDISDLLDDYESDFDMLDKLEELFKFTGIVQDLKEIGGK